jgi:hypothetical protein
MTVPTSDFIINSMILIAPPIITCNYVCIWNGVFRGFLVLKVSGPRPRRMMMIMILPPYLCPILLTTKLITSLAYHRMLELQRTSP